MSITGEQTFLSEGGVTVTRSRVVISNQTYPVNGITFVRTETVPPYRRGAYILGAAAALVLTRAPEGGISYLLFALIIFGLAAFLYVRAKPTYNLILGTAGGDRQALSSPDSEYISRVANAISDALVARG